MEKQNKINIQMRAILVDWLVEVQYKENFRIETLYQSIWIIDSYLSLRILEISKLQLFPANLMKYIIQNQKNLFE